MIHPDTELKFIDSKIGFGVFATKPIPRGSLIWVRDPLDREIDARSDHTLTSEMLEHYAYRLRDGNYLLCWDFARYMNHSCEPNSINPGLDFEFAVRDIAVGEQLTNDYVMLNLEASMNCACAAPSCRGVVDPADFQLLYEQWDAWVAQAFVDIERVEQPLWSLLSDFDRGIVHAAFRSPERIPSTRVQLFVPFRRTRRPARMVAR